MYFQHHFKGVWYQFDKSGQVSASSDTRSRTLPGVSGQKFNPATKMWNIFYTQTGRAVHGLENKIKYPNIEEMVT